MGDQRVGAGQADQRGEGVGARQRCQFPAFGGDVVVGIVLGVVALNQIKTSGEGGRGLAIAGIAVGAVTFLISIVFAISFISSS